MKVKKIRKKLTFNKETIAHLGNIEKKDVMGGGGIEKPASGFNSGCQGCYTYTCVPSNCSGLYCC
jgi:hypothetical protein